MELAEIELYLSTATLPKEVDLNPYEKIINLPLFIESHLGHCKAYEGKELAEPYKARLEQLVRILKEIELKKSMHISDQEQTFRLDL